MSRVQMRECSQLAAIRAAAHTAGNGSLMHRWIASDFACRRCCTGCLMPMSNDTLKTLVLGPSTTDIGHSALPAACSRPSTQVRISQISIHSVTELPVTALLEIKACPVTTKHNTSSWAGRAVILCSCGRPMLLKSSCLAGLLQQVGCEAVARGNEVQRPRQLVPAPASCCCGRRKLCQGCGKYWPCSACCCLTTQMDAALA